MMEFLSRRFNGPLDIVAPIALVLFGMSFGAYGEHRRVVLQWERERADYHFYKPTVTVCDGPYSPSEHPRGAAKGIAVGFVAALIFLETRRLFLFPVSDRAEAEDEALVDARKHDEEIRAIREDRHLSDERKEELVAEKEAAYKQKTRKRARARRRGSA